MSKRLRVLLAEDSEDDAFLLLRELRKGGFEVEHLRVFSAPEFAAALSHGDWDIVLCDHNMPSFDSTAALTIAKATRPDLPFIIVSGSIGEDVAVKAMRDGVQDYLMKGNLTRLVPAVERELHEAVERREHRRAERTLLSQLEEFRIGHEIQQRLFPGTAPVLPGFDIAGTSIPAAATGGDYFDYFPMGEGGTGIVIGDVSGHGVGPALLMADTRAYLRTLARGANDLGAILHQANQLIMDDFGTDRFVTILFTRLCPRERTLSYLNAGHPEGYVIDRGGAVKASLKASLPALGLLPSARPAAEQAVGLAPGDVVLLLTDGVTEAQSPDGEEFSVERTLEATRTHRAARARDILDAVTRAVQDFTKGAQQDDITAVVIKAEEMV